MTTALISQSHNSNTTTNIDSPSATSSPSRKPTLKMIYLHENPYTPLLSCLATHLPTSGPLLRRIQYQTKTPNPSPTAQVLASFPPGSTPGEDETWLAAYLDVYKGPDTQVWVFSSLEGRFTLPPTSGSTSSSHLNTTSQNETSQQNRPPGISEKERELAKSQLLELFAYIKKHLTPRYLEWVASRPQPTQSEKEKEAQGVKKIPDHPLSSVLVGSVHEMTVGLVCEVAEDTKHQSAPGPGLGKEDGEEESRGRLRIHRGQHYFYAKYCFPSSSFSSPFNTETNGEKRYNEDEYTFKDSSGKYGIQYHHLDLVKSRTNISRSKEALMAMGGVALYHRPNTTTPSPTPDTLGANQGEGEWEREMPIAWAFLGFDGSMSSLHVEPEHRGRGLGGLVGREVMKRGVDVFGRTPHATSITTTAAVNKNNNNNNNGAHGDSSSSYSSPTQPRPRSTPSNGSTSTARSSGDEDHVSLMTSPTDVKLANHQFQTQPCADSDFQESQAQSRNTENGNEEWFFADVAVQNTASRRVMEKMGGEARWGIAWIVIEVDL